MSLMIFKYFLVPCTTHVYMCKQNYHVYKKSKQLFIISWGPLPGPLTVEFVKVFFSEALHQNEQLINFTGIVGPRGYPQIISIIMSLRWTLMACMAPNNGCRVAKFPEKNQWHPSIFGGRWLNQSIWKIYIVAKLDHIPKYKGGEKPFETTT